MHANKLAMSNFKTFPCCWMILWRLVLNFVFVNKWYNLLYVHEWKKLMHPCLFINNSLHTFKVHETLIRKFFKELTNCLTTEVFIADFVILTVTLIFTLISKIIIDAWLWTVKPIGSKTFYIRKNITQNTWISSVTHLCIRKCIFTKH